MGDDSPTLFPLDDHPAGVVHACHRCGTCDPLGGFGPDMIDDASTQGVIENHKTRWYCARHNRELWEKHLHLQRLRPARLERLEQWKRGELDFQRARKR